MRHFPYDVQRCVVKMGSWTYDGSDVISYLIVSFVVSVAIVNMFGGVTDITCVQLSTCPSLPLSMRIYVITPEVFL